MLKSIVLTCNFFKMIGEEFDEGFLVTRRSNNFTEEVTLLRKSENNIISV